LSKSGEQLEALGLPYTIHPSSRAFRIAALSVTKPSTNDPVYIADQVMAFLFESVEPRGFPKELKQRVLELTVKETGENVRLLVIWHRFKREQFVDRIGVVALDPERALLAVDFFNLKPLEVLGAQPLSEGYQREIIAFDDTQESTIAILLERLTAKQHRIPQ
jgi:hypothetical protein